MPSTYWYDKTSALQKRLVGFATSTPEAIGTQQELVEYLGDLGITQMLSTAIRCTGRRILHRGGFLVAIDKDPTARSVYAGPYLSLNRTQRSVFEGKSYHAEGQIPIIGADMSIDTNPDLPEGAFNAFVSEIGVRDVHTMYRSGVDVSETNDPNTLLTVVRDLALAVSNEFGGTGAISRDTTHEYVANMPLELFTGAAVHGS